MAVDFSPTLNPPARFNVLTPAAAAVELRRRFSRSDESQPDGIKVVTGAECVMEVRGDGEESISRFIA
jgi:hypothetical protein